MPKIFWNIFIWQTSCFMVSISKVLFFKTLRSARAFVLKVGKSNPFDMCSVWLKVHVVFFSSVCSVLFFFDPLMITAIFASSYLICSSNFYFVCFKNHITQNALKSCIEIMALYRWGVNEHAWKFLKITLWVFANLCTKSIPVLKIGSLGIDFVYMIFVVTNT